MKYKTFYGLDEAIEAGCKDEHLLETYEWTSKYGDSPSCICLCDEEGIPEKLIGMDGGEREDQTLNRDWNWVVTALNEAFELGKNYKGY